VQAVCYGAEYAARFIIASRAGHVGKGSRSLGALQEESGVIPGENLSSAVSGPPIHQNAAARFLFLAGQLEHGGLALITHRQQAISSRHDGSAVGNKAPASEIRLEDRHCPMPYEDGRRLNRRPHSSARIRESDQR
jgi:hypothetical protein